MFENNKIVRNNFIEIKFFCLLQTVKKVINSEF